MTMIPVARIRALARAIDAVGMHWCGRAFYCPRQLHRHALRSYLSHLELVCVDCGRREDIGPVYVFGTNRKSRRPA